jgi:hypothetical protein
VRKLVLALVCASVALTVVALAAAKPAEVMVGAKLDAMQEVPHAMSKGTGTFTADIAGSTLTWRLTFSHLTGAATAAHIHVGKKGKSGNVLIPLCNPCKTGQKGSMKISKMAADEIERGITYVNVHTKRYVNGEIRGQLATH